MDLRRGRRPTPRSTWRRAAIPIVLLLAATLAAAATVTERHQQPPPLGGAFVLPETTPAAPRTPEDDVGTFVDPTPPPPVQLASGPRGPHLSLPILLYHYIRVNPVASDTVGFNLSVTPANFARQMAFLHFAGAHTLTLAEALAALHSGKALPPRSVILTFDDGYMNFATKATPVLIRNGLVGTVFVVSGFLGKNGYMTAAQVKQVDAEGMVVGVHTVNHVALADVPLDYAKAQIDISHQQLETLLGHHISDFAYPYGSFDAAVEKLVQDDGFSDAVTTVAGADLYAAQPYAWPRYHVGGSDTLSSFADKALLGMPLSAIDRLLAEFAATPAGSGAPTPAPSPTPSPHAVTALAGDDSRRYS